MRYLFGYCQAHRLLREMMLDIGVELNFAVEVLSIREATEDELAHGHVHGPGGHHH